MSGQARIASALAAGRLDEAIAEAWRRLPQELPPATLARALGPPALPSATLEALLASGRLRERLRDRVAGRLGIAPPGTADFDEPANGIALLGRASAVDAMHLAGVMRQAGRIGRLVLRRDRERVAEAVGREAFDLAIDGWSAGGTDRGADEEPPGGTGPVEALIDDCRTQGPICMAGWIVTRPPALAGWLSALLPEAAAHAPLRADARNIDAARRAALTVISRRHD